MDQLSIKTALQAWREKRRFHHSQFDIDQLAHKVQIDNLKVTVIVPGKEVAKHIGGVVKTTIQPLVDAKIITDVVVIDNNSKDYTGAVAAASGARVVQRITIASELGPSQGKGDALWRALQVTSGDIVAFLDGDTCDPCPAHLLGIIAPLIMDRDIHMVKGCFDRPFQTAAGEVRAHEGGRVTEILARPLLNFHYPLLAGFRQPLAGEFAARRSLLENLAFPVGYGVEIGTLIDSLELVGLDGLAEVDLGTRQNCHKSLRDLTPMAYAILCTLERRTGKTLSEHNLFLPWEDNYRDVSCLERVPLLEYRAQKAKVSSALSSPPFIVIPGVWNFRYVSSTEGSKTCSPQKLVYRSGDLSRLTQKGREMLQKLRIRIVYDLRSSIEVERSGFHDKPSTDNVHGKMENNGKKAEVTPSWEEEYNAWTCDCEGPERIFAPVFPDEDYGPEALAERFSDYASNGTKVSNFYSMTFNGRTLLTIVMR
jgi:glucosyl-3-phosphoglycerate synthase